MLILYGSQNFGYDTPDSDRDFAKFTFPTWEDMLSGKVVEREETCSTGIIKIKDIRTIRSMLTKPNFSSLQLFYSKEYKDCEDLDWFIQNRDRLLRANMYNLYKHNKPIIDQNADTLKPKSLARAYAYTGLLERALHSNEKFDLFYPDSGKYREKVEAISTRAGLVEQATQIKSEVEILENYFKAYEDTVDFEIIKAADDEIIRLLKKHLG